MLGFLKQFLESLEMKRWLPFLRRKKKDKRKDQARDLDADPLEKRTTRDTSVEPSAPQTPPTREALSEKSPYSPPQPAPPEFYRRESEEDITALPQDPRRDQSPHLVSSASRPASLHSKRSASNDPGSGRRKLSRRSLKDPRQLRVMTAPIPVPKMPGASRKTRDDINNSSSVVSLPQAPSVRSSVTGFSDNHYDVGTIDVFSPRPTIRYSMNSPTVSGALLRSAVTSRTENRREEEESPRQILRESKTIDDLANRYDATTVRELMERDAKRRERRREAQEDKARRRLERHAARERGEPVPPSRGKRRARSPRTEMAEHRRREQETGLGVTGAAADAESAKRQADDKEQSKSRTGTGDEDAVKHTEDLSQQNPFVDPASEGPSPMEEAVVSTAEAIRYSTASISPPVSPRVSQHVRKTSNISQITDKQAGSATNLAESPADRRASETSNRRGGPLSKLLRRDAPAGRGSSEKMRGGGFESSFTNVSRESMRGQLPPAHLRDDHTSTSRSSTPTRTMSKFREDLPEYKTTPPGSRTASPVDLPPPPPPPPPIPKGRLPESPLQQTTTNQEDPASRNDSMGSTKMLSQSLASVDSEGSWLSGKPAKRSSQQMTPQLLSERPDFRGSYEDLGVTDEEYFQRQAATQPRAGLGGLRAALKGDAEQSRTTGGEVEEHEHITRGDVSRRPTVIQQEDRKKSYEGLLNQYQEGESAVIEGASKPASSTPPGTEASPVDDAESPKPVVLGHARSVSRGSAKLLEIPSRRSTPSVSPQMTQGEFQVPKEEQTKE